MNKFKVEIIGTYSFKAISFDYYLNNVNTNKKECVYTESFHPFNGFIEFDGDEFFGKFTGYIIDCFGEADIVGSKEDNQIKFTKKYNPEKSLKIAFKDELEYIFNYSKYGWTGSWGYILGKDYEKWVPEIIPGKSICSFFKDE